MFFSVFAVALLAEGVDRNLMTTGTALHGHLSPSSRRAWIEIHEPEELPGGFFVALLAEGVDRNSYAILQEKRRIMSPSSRRAWIEIRW